MNSSRFLSRALAAVSFVLGCGLLSLPAQDPASPAAPPAQEATNDQRKALATMRALKVTIAETEAEIAEKRAALSAATTPGEQDQIGAGINTLNDKLATLQSDYEGVAAGIDLKAYTATPDEGVDLGSEMQDFLQPIVKQLKEMTSRPREIEELKSNVVYYAKRKQFAEKALTQVTNLLAAAKDPAVIADLEAIRKSWQQRYEQSENNLSIAQFQLDSKRAEKGTVIQSVSEGAGNFFRTRGRNLLVAALAFLVVFTLLRIVHRYIHRLSPMSKRGHRSIAVRIVDISYYVFTFVASAGVVLFVLYVTDDWVLLGLALLVIAGVAWAGKHTLPLFTNKPSSC